MNILKTIKQILFKYKYSKASPNARAEMMKKHFYHIGENVGLHTSQFGTEPYLISIGDNVTVAAHVKFITHDVSCFNMARYLDIDQKLVDKVNCIVLHDNCMIGAHSILLPGTSIGKNCVIAAGSVVTGIIPDNEVWGGNPARFIMKTSKYAQKVKNISSMYPWKYDSEGNLLNLNNDEIITLRQKYLFEQEINKRSMLYTTES